MLKTEAFATKDQEKLDEVWMLYSLTLNLLRGRNFPVATSHVVGVSEIFATLTCNYLRLELELLYAVHSLAPSVKPAHGNF
jgi:hypothetical protein